MKKCLFILALCLALSPTARAIDGIYLGGEVGHVGLTGSSKPAINNALGFGLDLGLQVNPMLDIMYRLQASSHSGGGGLTLYSQTLSADFHLWELNDLDFTLGGGPGFYFWKGAATTNTRFGINTGFGVDVKVDESIRIGLGWRYHLVLSPGAGEDNFWTVMMRVGYLFPLGGA